MSEEGRPGSRESQPSLAPYGPWLAFASIAVGLVVELSTSRSVMFVGGFVAAPLVAAALWTFAGTLSVFATSFTVMLTLTVWWDRLPAFESALRLATLLCVGVLALFINRDLRRSRMRLAASRRIAEAAQLAILPRVPGRIDGLTVAARYRAAHAGAQIGGDLYAVQRTPYGVRMLVGDVRGKGLAAVDALTVVLGAFREGAAREPDLAAVAVWIEQAMQRESAERGGPEEAEEFVTAVLVELPAREVNGMRIVNCGHPPPLLLSREGKVRALEPAASAPPLGLGSMASTAPWHADGFGLTPGALLLLYTDGVSEARDAGGAFYDPATRLAGRCFAGPGALLDGLLADVERHTGGRTSDDMALLAVMRGT